MAGTKVPPLAGRKPSTDQGATDAADAVSWRPDIVPTMSAPLVSQPFRGPASRSRRGQALAELALVLPLLLVIVGGIVQLGALFATQHTLVQIGRDLGRWAATQADTPCWMMVDANQPAVRADELAFESRLMGYAGEWADPAALKSYGLGSLPASPPLPSGVEVAWEILSGDCPPVDSTTAAFVTVRLAHEAPVLVPGLDLVLAWLPGVGEDGVMSITTTAKFRMEPQAAEPSSP